MSKIIFKINYFSSEKLKNFLKKDKKFQQGLRLYTCYQVSSRKRP